MIHARQVFTSVPSRKRPFSSRVEDAVRSRQQPESSRPMDGGNAGIITEFHLPEGASDIPRLVLPAMARLSQQESRWILWVFPPRIPIAPVLATAGIHPGRMLVVRPRRCGDPLPVLESALRAGNCSMVLAWTPVMDETSLSQLREAAEEGNTLGVLFSTAKPDSGAGLQSTLPAPREALILGGQQRTFRIRADQENIRQLALAL